MEPEKLRALFEAARWAASSYGDQPWDFIVTTKDDRTITSSRSKDCRIQSVLGQECAGAGLQHRAEKVRAQRPAQSRTHGMT